jgi:quercetin dioxygenase-like cupin family protein
LAVVKHWGHDWVIGGWGWKLFLAALVTMQISCDWIGPGASETTTARSWQATTIDLAGGRLPALPSGPLYVRVVDFAQDAGSAFTSHQHVPGFVYVQTGAQRLVIADGPSIDITAGDAFYLGSLTHAHLNPGAEPNHWYFIALWPTEARGIPLADTSARVAFATPDLPEGALPSGSYVSTLQLVQVKPGGRTVAHSHGGVEVLFVLEGSISVQSANDKPTTLGPGQGIHHLPNTVLQEVNLGDVEARYLAFLLTADDQPFQTNVRRSP